MAHRVARPTRYQGGASFNVFSAQGSNPTGDCKVCGKGVQKLYDKSVKTYVYSLCGGPTSKLQLPKDENKTGLQLLQPFVVFQIFVPASQPLAFELRVTDTSNTRRKMYFSTSFSDIKSTPLHCQIPITMVTHSIWLSLSIHVADLFAHCFRGMVFKSVDTIVLGPVCKLRKIFTMRNRLSDIGSLSNSFDVNNEDYLPQEHMFALGVDNAIQVLDMIALHMIITDLSDPSHGTEEDTLKLRKVKLNKLESRQVHVAFGSRMPLPLSTVQINTNLPGDNKHHSNKAYPKEQEQIDRINQSTHSQIEIPLSILEQNRIENKVENKSETLQNLLKHANNFNKNHAMMKLKKDTTLLNQCKLPKIDGPAERSHSVHFTTQELQLPSNLTITNAFKQIQKPVEAGIEGIMALTSLTKDEMMNMLSKEDPTITHLQWSNDKVYPKQMPQSVSLDNVASNDETLDTIINKVISEEPPTYVPKKFEEYKLSDPTMGLGKYVQKGSHVDGNRRKEYKQSRYMDSPPESPPCGWTSCIEDDSEEKPLKIPSFFSKICDNMDDLERSKYSIDIGSTITSNEHLMDSSDLEDVGEDEGEDVGEGENEGEDEGECEDEGEDAGEDEGQCIEEGIQKFLSDEDAKYDYSSENLHTERSMKDIVRPTSESNDSMEDRPRPVGVTHEKFDLGNGDNFMFHDSEIAEAMSDEDYSSGRHSWSSNDHSQGEQGHTSNLFTQFSYHPNFHNDEVTCNNEKWKNSSIQNDLQGGEQFLVIDRRPSKNSHDTSQESSTFQNDDKNNDDDPSNHHLKFLNKYIDDHDSFEFDNIIKDDFIENLRLSPIITRPQSRTSYKETMISTCNEDALHGMLTSSSDSMESNSKHSISSFTLKNEQGNVKEVEIFNCIVEHEDAGITVNNGRHDEDLDLLYDPTLDCYYDPKTNRYYELK